MTSEISAEKLASMRKNGMRISEIAKNLGASRETIRKKLKDVGLTHKDPHGSKPKCAPDLAQIRQMYEGGMTMRQLAEHFRVSPSAVYKWVRRSGSAFENKRGNWRGAKQTRNQEVVRQRAAGMKIIAIAAEHKISWQRVYQILNKEAGR